MAEGGRSSSSESDQEKDEPQFDWREYEERRRRGPNSYSRGWTRRFPPGPGDQYAFPGPRQEDYYYSPTALEQGRASEAKISIHDDTYPKYRGPASEMEELRYLLQQQQLEMMDLKKQLARTPPVQPAVQVDKVFLESLAPMEYSGEGDFQEYLNQFEAMAETLFWNEAKKGSALYGRLKGRALACVSSCPDRQFSTLVQRLKDRFSPKDEEMFYQQLTTYRKKPDQSWEDLAQEMERLSIKAYAGMEEKYRDSMAAKAFVEAVVDKDVRRRLRQKHPKTINEAVRHARMIEADQLREDLWQEFDSGKGKDSKEKKTDKTRAVEATKPRGSAAPDAVAAPKKVPAKGRGQGGKRRTDPKSPRSTGKPVICFLCGVQGHVQRKCPFRLMTGASSAQMSPGLAQLPYPALPMVPGQFHQYQVPSGSKQENYKGQTQFPAAQRNLPNP